MSEWPAWQPIETAPRDGTLVLVWNIRGHEPVLAKFEAGFWRHNHYAPREPIWLVMPTHWMPLPELPAP